MKKHFLLQTALLLVCSFLFGQSYNMSNQTVNTCAGSFYDSGGNGGQYGNNQNLTMTFCSNNGQNIYVQFTSFAVESGWDYLYVYNGPSTASPQVAGSPFTGGTSPGTITGSGTCLTFVFTSDGSVTQNGWTATIGCGTPPPPPPPPPPAAGDCANANPFCTGTTYTFPAATGTTAQTGPNYGCLFTQPNPAWYFMQIQNPGNLTISMSNSAGVDIDFVAWGPFTSMANACNSLTGACNGPGSNPLSGNLGCSGGIVDCSYSTSSTETCGIQNTQTGEFYIICITNFANVPTNITFSQTGGPATTNCNILCNMTGLTATPGACQPATNTYDVTGTINFTFPPASGTFTVTSSCGGTATINPPWVSPMTYTLTGINPTGTNCTVTAGFSADPTCTLTATYTSPAPCNTTCNPTASNTGPYCAGQTIQLNGGAVSGAVSYTWTGPGAYSASGQNVTITNAQATHSGTYTLTVNNGTSTCTATTSVVVNPLPVPAPGNTGPYCQGATINLSSSGGGTYAWSGPNGFTSTAQNPTIAGATPVMGGVYTVTVTTNGCTATGTTNVTVNPTPTPTAGNTSPVCVGANFNLSSTGGGTYSWSGPNGFTSTQQNPSLTNAQTNMSGVYTVTVTSAASCTATATTNVTVNALPVPTASSNSPVCTGFALNFTGNPAGMTSYSWSGPGGYTSTNQNPSINPAAPANSGTYTLTVTDANGCTANATTVASVNASLAVVAGNGGPYCEGSTGGLTSNTGVNWAWSGPNGFSSTQQNPSLGATTTIMNGTYTVTATDANGCQGTATTNVVVNALPVVTPASNSPICTNQALNLTSNAVAGGVYSWSGPNVFTSNQQNPSIAGATTAASGTYTLSITDANNCQSTATINVTVNPLPVVNAGSNSPICEGTSLNLTSGGGTTYSWSGPNNFTSNQQNPSVAGATTAASGVYVVTVTDANNCTNAAFTNVTVDPNPVPTASNNGPLCVGATLNLSGMGTGASWSWSGPNGFTSTQQNPSLTNAQTNMSGVYTVTLTTAASCTATATTNVTINAIPVPLATANTPCVGQALNLTGTPAGMNTYSWNGPNGFGSSNQNPTMPSATVNMSGTYTLSVTDAAGCSANTTVVVTVNPLPTPNPSNTSPVCQNGSFSLSASGGTNYVWSGPGGYSSALQNPTVNPATVANSGTYQVTVTDVNGCQNTGTTNVTVNPLPSPTAGTSAPVCEGQSFTVNGNGGSSYSWLGPNGFNGNTQSATVTNSTQASAGVYTVTATDANGCVNTATVSVAINAAPALVMTPTTASGCAPLCVSGFSVTSTPAALAYSWNLGNGSTSNIANPTNICYINGGYYAPSVTVTDINGCTNIVSAGVNVYDNPTAQFAWSPAPASILDPNVQFTDFSLAGSGTLVSWAWTLGTPDSAVSTAQNPGQLYPDVGFYNVTLIVTNSNGCVDTISHVVEIEDDYTLYIPNAFSPNNDGINDVFFAKGVGVKDFEMWIYDRWGNKIFYTNEFGKVWDGRINGEGEVVLQDVYVWKVKVKNFKNEKKELHGTVTVVR